MINFGLQSSALNALRHIHCTRSLPTSWNHGRGVASTTQARQGATLIVALLSAVGVDEISIFPDTDGGIMVVAYRGSASFEIFTASSGETEAMFEDEAGSSPIRAVDDFAELKKMLGEKGWRESSISASFLQYIMMFEKAATTGLPSKIRATTVAYPLLTWIARSQPQGASVLISSHSIPQGFPAPQPHFGGLSNQRWRQTAPLSRKTPLLEITATTI